MEWQQKLYRSLIIIAIAITTLVLAKGFLIPMAFAMMLAMLLLPYVSWMERKSIPRLAAAFLALVSLISFLALVVFIISLQASKISTDAGTTLTKLEQLSESIRLFIERKIGISENQNTLFKPTASGWISFEKGNKWAIDIAEFFATMVLVLVYTFLFIYYRKHLSQFIIRVMPETQKAIAKEILKKIEQVTQQYLSGLGIMIVVLWLMYGVGFSIIGIEHALFFAVLCGLLEIVPYVGNFTGSMLTALMAFTYGGTGMALWVLAVYAFIQFTQTYFLEPLILGAKVKINPIFTIAGLLFGELIWGISGLILAIPFMGIVKIICDQVPSLSHYGFLIGEVVTRKSSKEAEGNYPDL